MCFCCLFDNASRAAFYRFLHKLEHISNIQRLIEDDFVWMDRFTIRNLELYHGNTPGAVTLLDIIDSTISPMGGRMLKRWLALPLKNEEDIKTRHEIVRFFIQNENFLEFQNKQIECSIDSM